MMFAGHTPLLKMPDEKLSVQQKTILSSLWVESVEEFTAMMAAMEDAQEADERSVLMTLRRGESSLLEDVPVEALAPWRNAYAAGALGCAIKPEVIDMYLSQGRLGNAGSTMQQVSDAPLPPRVSLAGKLFGVRDQGSRGTCVAFASTALREYLAGCSTELSEQFLYWACKSIDGCPDMEGTLIHTAMSALSTKGICQSEIWPYNPERIEGNESQSPPPDGAQQSALGFTMQYTRTVAPNIVNHYKQVLSGADGLGGMPVVIASLVFNSWLRSAATRQSGKITMPLPGEEPLMGGHAMLVVGYQDDTSVPGGGYFIVRNSWSEDWALKSPEAAGHALMPYAYVERCVVEAFSGRQMTVKLDSTENANAENKTGVFAISGNSFEEKYVRTLRREGRDMDRKLLVAGTRVISNPDAPDEFMEDDAKGSNRRLFKERHFAWSDQIRRQSIFTSAANFNSSLKDGIALSQTLCQQFCAAIDTNIKAAIGRSIPDINLSPILYGLAWMPKIKKVELAADLSEELIKAVCRKGRVPEDVVPTAEWQSILQSDNCMKVYRLDSRFGDFAVVSVYITPFDFSRGDDIAISGLGCEFIDIVRGIYSEYAKKMRIRTKFVFYTLCSGQLSDNIKGIDSGDHQIVLSDMDNGKWHTVCPPEFDTGLYLRNFIERLSPETRQQKISNIKSAIDDIIDSGYEGNILVERIKKQTGYRRTVVKDAFDAMQRSGHYECYKVGGEPAIRRIKGRKPNIINISTEPCFAKYHLGMISGTLITVFFSRLSLVLGSNKLSIYSILIATCCIYIGKCVEVIIKRNS